MAKGDIARGREPPRKEGAGLGPLGEYYPWREDLASWEAFSLLGALCHVAKAPPDDERVQAARARLCEVLEERGVTWTPETWADAPERTKHDVVRLLQEAAE